MFGEGGTKAMEDQHAARWIVCIQNPVQTLTEEHDKAKREGKSLIGQSTSIYFVDCWR